MTRNITTNAGLLDALQWDRVIEERVTEEAKSGVAAAGVREGLANARLVFGEDIWAIPELVLRNLLNRAPWTHEWFNWLADALKALEKAGGYDLLVRRLGREDLFTEAYSVIRIAERFRTVGLIVDIDVPIAIVGTKPDLRVTDPETGATFFVELSDLFLSERQVTSAEDLDRLMSILRPMLRDVAFAGRVLGDLSAAGIEAFGEKVRIACREAEAGHGYREITIPGVAEFAIGHRAFAASLLAWALPRGLPFNGVAGLNPNVDLGIRFERKVARKARQLPPGSPNVVVIGSTELFCSGLTPQELVSLVGKAVAPHPQAAVIVVAGEEGASSTPAAIDIESALLLRSYRGGMTHHFLVMPNSLSAQPMPPLTFEKVRSGFAL